MRQTNIPLTTQFYADDARSWSVQDIVNYIPEVAEVQGTASPMRLRTAPGLREEALIGSTPIRGIHNAEGAFFVVQGSTLYQYLNSGMLKPLGLIPGSGPVQITHNQFGTGNQVLVENGQPGGGYVWNTVSQSFSIITDEGYPGSISTDYLDQYMIGVEPFGRFWFHSNLANATDYNTLDRYESEASPDKIVAIKAINGDVMVLNQSTIEFFRNTGAATNTFQRIQGAIINEGCASGRSVVRMDNSVFWMGADGVIYRLNGYAAQPVSTRAIERAIANQDWSNAIGFTLEEESHKIYYLHFPNGYTWGYDVVTQLWHRRECWNSDRWRINDIVRWGRKTIASDVYTGRLWRVDWKYFLEGQTEYVCGMTSPCQLDDGNAFNVLAVEFKMDTGQEDAPVVIPDPIPPTPQNPPAPQLVGTLASWNVWTNYSSNLTIVSAIGAATVTQIGGTPLPPGSSIVVVGTTVTINCLANTYTGPDIPLILQVTDSVGRTGTWTGVIPIALPVANWVVVGDTKFSSTSADGTAYSAASAMYADADSTGPYQYTAKNGIGYMVGYLGGPFRYSANGTSWVTCAGPATISPVGRQVANNGAFLLPDSFKVSRSIGGAAYTQVWAADAFEVGRGIGNNIILVREGAIGYVNITSNNGTGWTGKANYSDTACDRPSIDINHLTNVNIVAYGDGAASRITIRRTTNEGTSWGPLILPFGASGYNALNRNMICCASNAGYWVLTVWRPGTLLVAYSTDDGLTWTSSSIPSTNQPSAMATDGFRMTISFPEALYTTTNGSTWAPITIPSMSTIQGIMCATTAD